MSGAAPKNTPEGFLARRSFIELRARLHNWLEEPPVAVPHAYVAFSFIDFVGRFTPEDGFWYPVRDHDRYPDIGEWGCEDFERLRPSGEVGEREDQGEHECHRRSDIRDEP